MTYPTIGRRLGRWKAVLGLTLSTSALLGLSATANANTYTPAAPGGLEAAISAANTNAGPDVIQLCNCNYKPAASMTITGPLTITGDPQNQPPGQGPQIDGGLAETNTPGNLIVLNAGVSATFKAFLITSASEPGSAAILVNGTAELDNMSLSGNNGTQLIVAATGTANSINTNISDGTANGVNNSGNLTLLNNTVTGNSSGGITNTATLALKNTLVVSNDPLSVAATDCAGAATSNISSMDSDSTCGVALHTTNPNLALSGAWGGPTPSRKLNTGSPAINAGNNAICPTTDQRFFVRDASTGNCDIGSYEVNAVRDTTLPACVVTRTQYPPAIAAAQQDVTVTDSGSGMGPAPDPISNIVIDNGSVAFTPFSVPSRSGLVVTATKATQATATHWSFTATDWAGNSKACS
jgi:hypothetical protein